MSQVKLQASASGTGALTIAAPVTNTDRTLTLPDASGTVQVSGNPISGTTAAFSGDVTLGSSVLATPTGSAPSYLCRAWVNFNGTGTVAIRASGNVSSITDNGTGDYTVNFTTAMVDANYGFSGSVAQNFSSGNQGKTAGVYTQSTGNTRVQCGFFDAGTTALRDCEAVYIAIFR